MEIQVEKYEFYGNIRTNITNKKSCLFFALITEFQGYSTTTKILPKKLTKILKYFS